MIRPANGHQLDLFDDVVVREDWVAHLDAGSDAVVLPAKRVAGLFAGIGGFELGLSRAAHETLLLCENDSGANAVLDAHFPAIRRHSDVRTLTEIPDDIDLIAAGFPCQDLSQAGKNYAERLSRLLAPKIANGLRADFDGITPDEKGKGQELKARMAKGFKKLDVNYSKPEIGLGLGVSIKTLNFRDPKSNRYTKKLHAYDNELRAEAHDYHERQPYTVMVAIVSLPADSCEDASKREPSSFGQAVRIFRLRSRRVKPSDSAFLFERIFIGLYESEGPNRGDVAFFDVEEAPPKAGRPSSTKLLSFDNVIAEIKKTYDQRNNPPFEWAEE